VRRILGVLALAKSMAPLPSMKLRGSPRDERARISFRASLPGALSTSTLSLRLVDPLIRELVYYRDLIQTKT